MRYLLGADNIDALYELGDVIESLGRKDTPPGQRGLSLR